MKNLIDLTGKTILVTGASSGIGRQTAVTLSEVGAKVILTARREAELQKTMEMLSGNGHAYYPYDICDLEGMDGFVKKIVEEKGHMQGLVFCAGIAESRPCKMTTPEAMHHMMMTNFFSFYEMVRQFMKKKYSDEGSKIVVVSSVASIRPGKGQSAYAASKAAIDASILVLAQELMIRRININSVRPGMVNSPMIEKLTEENKKVEKNIQPLGFVSMEDVAGLNAYLVSPAADMITGQGFDIDGGRLCNERYDCQ